MTNLDKLNSTYTEKLRHFGLDPDMKEIEILDRRATAIANGYTPEQAETLLTWTPREFVIFFNEQVIRADGKPIKWVFTKAKVTA